MLKVTFSRELAGMILDAFGKNKCTHCGVELTADNFAGATRDMSFCTNTMCLFEVAAAIKADDEA